jgi:hypothetical protein
MYTILCGPGTVVAKRRTNPALPWPGGKPMMQQAESAAKSAEKRLLDLLVQIRMFLELNPGFKF